MRHPRDRLRNVIRDDRRLNFDQQRAVLAASIDTSPSRSDIKSFDDLRSEILNKPTRKWIPTKRTLLRFLLYLASFVALMLLYILIISAALIVMFYLDGHFVELAEMNHLLADLLDMQGRSP